MRDFGHAQGAPPPKRERSFFQPNGIADRAADKYVFDQAKREKFRLRQITEL